MEKIFGRKPILEAIKAGENIEQIYVVHGTKGEVIYRIKSLAKKRGVKFSEISSAKFKTLTQGKNTQGIVALKSEKEYLTLDELLGKVEFNSSSIILILEQIQDPHNLGAILRTADCAGVDGVILTTNNTAPINDTAIKISAGAVSHLNICKVSNLVQALDILKKEHFWVVGSYLGNEAIPYFNLDAPKKIALIVGNEENGLRLSTMKKCDYLVEIPMKGEIQSLNVSVATGVLLFELVKNKNN